MSRRQLVALLCAIVFALPLTSAGQTRQPDLSGTWTGTFQSTGEADEDTAHFVFKQSGSVLTGTGGPRADQQRPIVDGRVTTTDDGTTASFDVDGGGVRVHFELTLVDGRLKGTANGEQNGRKMTASVDVGRAP